MWHFGELCFIYSSIRSRSGNGLTLVKASTLVRNCWKSNCIRALPSLEHFLANEKPSMKDRLAMRRTSCHKSCSTWSGTWTLCDTLWRRILKIWSSRNSRSTYWLWISGISLIDKLTSWPWTSSGRSGRKARTGRPPTCRPVFGGHWRWTAPDPQIITFITSIISSFTAHIRHILFGWVKRYKKLIGKVFSLYGNDFK